MYSSENVKSLLLCLFSANERCKQAIRPNNIGLLYTAAEDVLWCKTSKRIFSRHVNFASNHILWMITACLSSSVQADCWVPSPENHRGGDPAAWLFFLTICTHSCLYFTLITGLWWPVRDSRNICLSSRPWIGTLRMCVELLFIDGH